MEGFIFFLFAVLVVGAFWTLIGFFAWTQLTKKGQRFMAKDARKRELRRGMREAEIHDGLDEEILREEFERELRKQKKE